MVIEVLVGAAVEVIDGEVEEIATVVVSAFAGDSSLDCATTTPAPTAKSGIARAIDLNPRFTSK